MKYLLIAALLAPLTAVAGDVCDDSCTTGCTTGCNDGRRCCSLCDDASDYRCKLTVKEVDAEKSCFKVECVPVVLAPVSCGQNDCCKSCGGTCGTGGYCTGCGTVNDCCDAGCCDDTCDGDAGCGLGCGSEKGLKGLLSKLCQKKCRVRMVKKISKDSKPNGTKCEFKWEAVSACGCHDESFCDSGACVP